MHCNSAVLAILASALLAGTPSTAPRRKNEGSTQKSSSAQDDSRLEKAIRARFSKSKISVNNFQVRVQGGLATIEGKCEVMQHKGTATRLAKAAGALQVVNRIEIAKDARDKAAANLAKGRRRQQIKRSETENRSAPRSEPSKSETIRPPKATVVR